MAEELVEYENTVEDQEGRSWVARVLGAERGDGRWVGWIRFRDTGADRLIETERETTQPDREDLVYWAKGLTYFALRFRSRNTGAVLANWVWSRLKGTGATVHVNGEPVELSQDAFSQAVVGG